MKNKIKCIWQPVDENILVVEYKSGARRYCYLDGCKAPFYRMTATQRTFFENATPTEHEYYTE